MHVSIVTGTRPQIIKTVPLLHAIDSKGIDYSFIHTGQHYDYEMAAQFIEGLEVKEPHHNLEVGSGTNAYQTYETLKRLSELLETIRPDYLITPGDTNSALGAALAGFKMDIPTCHLESGLRSYDMRMQEELNRRMIDHSAAALFAPTELAVKNLEEEKVRGSIFHTGDTMYDILKERIPKFKDNELVNSIASEKLGNEEFAVMTLHRRENVDVESRLDSIIAALGKLEYKILFPAHPRTVGKIKERSIDLPDNIVTTKPLAYDIMMGLVAKSSLLITDSGGLQKEAYLLDTPCMTIRDNTEWIETIEAGANVLASPDTKDIIEKSHQMWGKPLKNDPSVYGDGKASMKIVDILTSGQIEIKANYMVK
ncbi:MAG: non-hydrolyzing UDP-N-acetylglucosamine 2-epimerase [Candidatus Thorarchaeota archaeon]